MKTIKIFMIILMAVSLLLATGCADNKKINGDVYVTYGLINESDLKNPDIKYELSIGNIVWSIILCETIIAPFYFIGFSLYEPVGPADVNLKILKKGVEQ